MQPPDEGSKLAPPPSSRRPQAASFFTPGLRLAAGLVLLGVLTWLALRQEPRPDPFEPVTRGSLSWWRYPVERNAFTRLPAITADLNDVFVVEETGDIWAVGSGGMIVHSADSGRSWEQQKVDWTASAQPRTAEAQAASARNVRNPTNRAVPGGDTRPSSYGTGVARLTSPASSHLRSGSRARRSSEALDPDVAPRGTRSESARDPLMVASAVALESDSGRNFGGIFPSAYAMTAEQPQKKARDALQGNSSKAPELAPNSAGQDLRQQQIIDPKGPSGSEPNVDEGDAQTGVEPLDEGIDEPGARDLSSVCFVDSRRGWIVGQDGTILATTDGGATWARQSSGTTVWLASVRFLPDGLRGWVTGPPGFKDFRGSSLRYYRAGTGRTTLTTVDGGATWQVGYGDQEPVFNSFQLLSDGLRGWAVENRGQIYRTTDGGASWELSSGTDASLQAIQFLTDGRRGWAAGDSGTILATSDGGTTWEAQSSGTRETLNSIHLHAEGQRAWVVGERGTILATTDGGSTWVQRSSGTGEDLAAIRLHVDGEDGWAVGPSGTFLATRDGGATWHRQSRMGWTSSHYSSDGRRGWLTGPAGTVLATPDGGETWQPQRTGTRENLRSVRFLADRNRGWAVGDGGVVLSTSDGGATWTFQQSGTDNSLSSVWFHPDGLRGWAVGSFIILTTTNGGVSWTRQPWSSGGWYNSVFFLDDGLHGWVAGSDETGSILTTNDGGIDWGFQPTEEEPRTFNSVQILSDGQRGWAVGSQGTIEATSDGGVSWAEQSSGAETWLSAVHFLPDGLRGWVVGEGGELLTTDNGGATWKSRPATPRVGLRSVQFLDDGLHGFVAGDAGTILRTTDGGETWVGLEGTYRKWPAPWYWASAVGLLLFTVVPALRKKEPETVSDPTVADMLASDRPLEKGDPDPLALGDLAGGVSRFLANENTIPPLTLAVTGDWGTGKSSLMNLIRSELGAYGFPCAWFNVWHHQADEDLLASFLETMESQAIPAWWTFEGIRIRLRLLMVRGAKHWLPAAILLVVVTSLVASLVRHPGQIQQAWRALGDLARFEVPDQYSSLINLVLAALGSGFILTRGTSTFGAVARSLGSRIAGGLGIRGKTPDSGFRERFSTVFSDVTRALEPRRLAIFIDDLDRCSPDKTVRALEMINYLVASGRCFVIVGMAPKWVIRAVGLGFRDVAEEMYADDETVTDEANLEKRALDAREKFARNYLEKLINIEVPIPTTEAARMARLLVPEAAGEIEEEPKAPREESRVAALARAVARGAARFVAEAAAPVLSFSLRYAGFLLFLGLVAVGLFVGRPFAEQAIDWLRDQPERVEPARHMDAEGYAHDLVDVDRDGRLDLFSLHRESELSGGVGNERAGGFEARLLRNEGGTLSESSAEQLHGLFDEASSLPSHEWIDVDGDNDLDLVFAGDEPGAAAYPLLRNVKGELVRVSAPGEALQALAEAAEGATPEPRPEPATPDEGHPPATFTPAQAHQPPGWLFYGVLAALALAVAVRFAIRPLPLEKDSPRFLQALGVWHPVVYEGGQTPRSAKRFLNRVRYFAMLQRPAPGAGEAPDMSANVGSDAGPTSQAISEMDEMAMHANAHRVSATGAPRRGVRGGGGGADGRSIGGGFSRLRDSSAALFRRVGASIRAGSGLGSMSRARESDAGSRGASAGKRGAIPEDHLVALSAIDHAHPAIFQEHTDLATLKTRLREVPVPEVCSWLHQRLLGDPRLDEYLRLFRAMASGVKIRR